MPEARRSQVKQLSTKAYQALRDNILSLQLQPGAALVERELALDLSMRPCLVFHMKLRRSKIGTFDLELVEEFFKALCNHAKITLHINLLYGRNSHHMVEAVFKGFGRALKQAVSLDERSSSIPSTKGIL